MSTRDLGIGLIAGVAGTTAMTAGYALERTVRRSVEGPLDYDDSNVPAFAAARVIDWVAPSVRPSRALGLLVHWGYGSLVGVAAVPLVRRTGTPAAIAGYWAGITVMAGSLFPTLGQTPPPWRWPRDMIATSMGQHLIYAGVVVGVLRSVTPRRPERNGRSKTTKAPAAIPVQLTRYQGQGPSTLRRLNAWGGARRNR